MGEPPTLERFLEALKGTNPFRGTRVTDPASSDGDVTEVHAAAFEKLTRWVGSARGEKMPVGVLLQGAAGVGKSHLIARLFQWAREDHATVVYLHNVLASPERMLRYLLYATVSDLVGHRPDYAESRLYALLMRAVLKGGPAKSQKLTPAGVKQRHQAMIDLGRQIDPSGTVAPVLAVFLDAVGQSMLGERDEDARARAAVHWLSGEPLDDREAELLGKPAAEQGAGLADDAEAERVLHVLARLCAKAERPLVLCLDQVDNLDDERVTALIGAAHALLDRGQHLVVLVSGVKESLMRLRGQGVIGQAAWDRIADRLLELVKITPEQGRAIVERRLQPMMSVFREVPEVAKARGLDLLFPIGSDWLRGRIGELPELRPRDIVTWARDRWDEQQDQVGARGAKTWLESWTTVTVAPPVQPPLEALIDDQVRKKLAEGVSRRRLQPSTLPADADNLASLVFELLKRCTGDPYTLRELSRVRTAKKPAAYQITAKEQRGDGLIVSDGLTFVTADHGNSCLAALARMLDDAAPPDHRILVTDNERRPLQLGARGEETYEKLCRLGRSRFLHIKLTFASYAELDSMMGVLGAARVADLEVEHPHGKPYVISETEVVASLHRLGQFLAHPVLRELLTEELVDVPASPPAGPVFDERRAREHIMGELSWRLGLFARELAKTFASRERFDGAGADHVWARLKDIARRLHDEGNVYATAQDDDLFLQLRKKAS
jgi:hypothetical protein